MSSKPRQTESEYVGRPTLKGRGWTDSMIAKFLPAPDETTVNPHYISGPPRKLYLLSRVRRIERTKRFRVAMEQAVSRKKAADKATETKREKLRNYLETVVIEVPILDAAELLRRACDHFDATTRSDSLASLNSDQSFLDRITVNYLRHKLSRYEDELEAIAGKVGAREVYLEVFDKVMDAISDAYPDLADECWRQSDKKWGEY